MAYIFRRGASIPFTQIYYDSTGGVTHPTSVRVWVTYATTANGGFPFCAERETTNFTLTQNSSKWEGSWSSTAAKAGMVYYHIKPAQTTLDVVDGEFELRGNPANAAST
jgi:hypothetical protein